MLLDLSHGMPFLTVINAGKECIKYKPIQSITFTVYFIKFDL